MKYFLSIFFLSFCLNHLSAQEKHFVFIQSDNKQPFYVSVNGKLYSSTASGYVIIPKLADGNYNFTVGFAQNTYPEQTFTTVIQNKDLGFDLKNFGEKGWGLFNLQSLDVTMATTANTNVVAKALSESSNAKAPEAVISFDKKKDTAVQLISKVASDSLVNSAVAKGEDVKEPITKVDSIISNQKTAIEVTSTPTATPKAIEVVANADKAVDVKKVSEVTGEEGVRLSYVEGSGKNIDTIHVVIPSSSVTTNSSVSTSAGNTLNISKKNVDSSNTASSSASTGSAKSDLKFLDINMVSKKDTAQAAPLTSETFKVMENSNCKNVATEEDYAKLRKKMAMETSDEKMISEAKKAYRNKCFTTGQIKGLSTLFLSDEGRFKFFDASFVSVADAGQYYTLQAEFIDPAFVNRFKALLQ
ncbi:MAG: hypothetical protein JWQ09_3955 [Segetibacter sp.]|nr:hypothetical protein [Segetibacter sp.]